MLSASLSAIGHAKHRNSGAAWVKRRGRPMCLPYKCKEQSLLRFLTLAPSGVDRWFALLKMTSSRCLCAVGAGLVPALCSQLLFWAPTRDAPTGAVLCYLYPVLFRADTPVPPLQALYSVLFLNTHKGCPYGFNASRRLRPCSR